MKVLDAEDAEIYLSRLISDVCKDDRSAEEILRHAVFTSAPLYDKWEQLVGAINRHRPETK